MTRKQCAKCPWKVTTDPYDIPNGYDAKKHAALDCTIAKEPLATIGGALRIMACHETHEEPCVGWLVNQLGEGNNIGLRIAVMQKRVSADVELDGKQHKTLAATLPKRRRKVSRGK